MHPDALVIIRIDMDLAVIDGARVGVGHPGPCLAFIFTAEDAAAGVFNQRVNNVGVPAIEADANAPDFFHGCRVRRRHSRFRLLLLGTERGAAAPASSASTKAACAGQWGWPWTWVPRQPLFQFLPGSSAIGGFI